MEYLRGDKVRMSTHTCPHKPLRKNKVTLCNRQADSPLYVTLFSGYSEANVKKVQNLY